MARKTRKKQIKSRQPSAASRAGKAMKGPHFPISAASLPQAVELHQQGQLEQARQAYEQILVAQPEHAEAIHLLGVVDHQTGQHERAVERITQALQLLPGTLLFKKNLAAAARSAGNLALAEQMCREALAENNRDPLMWQLLGQLSVQQQAWSTAVEAFVQAEQLELTAEEKLQCRLQRGDCLSRLKRSFEAIACFEAVTAEYPDQLVAVHNLAREYQLSGQLERAIDWYERTLKLDPECASAWNNLGVIYQNQALFERARECVERARAAAPQLPDVHNNLANIQEALGNPEQGQELLERAIQLRPEYAEAWHSLGQLHLRAQNFAEGWEYYRWRLKKQDHDHRHYKHPVWQGQALSEEKLLVYSEQGIGDVVMFASCLPDVLARVEHVCLEVDPRMLPLFARSFPQTQVIPRPKIDPAAEMRVPGVDWQISLGELPGLFRRSADEFPRQAQLLTADSRLLEKWRARFAELGSGLNVGISWFGGKNLELQVRRALPLTYWTSILTIPGVNFINLQYGPRAEERKSLEQSIGVTVHDWADSNPLVDLDDFTAKLAALDLVISIDNATVHFAGGAGVPTWAMLAAVPDWRWGLHSEQTAWYDSVRLYRQQQQGNWGPVIQQVSQKLRQLAEMHAQQAPSRRSQPTETRHQIPGEHNPTPELPRETNSAVAAASTSGPLNSTGPAAPGRGAVTLSATAQRVKPRCAIVSPVGPGHEKLYLQAERSIRDACVRGAGPFREVIPFRLDDTQGKYGRSRARNFAEEEAHRQGIEWLFFLDADDLLVPDVFVQVQPYLDQYDAIWGQIYSFADGSHQAERREGQLGLTDRFADVLNCDPFLSLQMGHFVRTSVARQYPFNEQMDAGEDFDYYLRVWSEQRCIKLDVPLFANRRGRHSSGPRSANGQQWMQVVHPLLQQYRQRFVSERQSGAGVDGGPAQSCLQAVREISVDRGSAPVERTCDPASPAEQSSRGMKLAIYGMMRSGTTLLCDKLTVPGQGLVLLEPNIHLESKPEHVRRQLERFGLQIPDSVWEAGTRGQSFQTFFEAELLPRLQQLDYWGVKMVNFTRWQEFLQRYPTEYLLLCVRDIRDVVLSALDLAPKLGNFVDSAWIERRALETASALVEMSQRPHRLMRYEDFCSQPELIDQLAATLGLQQTGKERFGLEAVPHRLYEEQKHGGQVSDQSVGRFASEPAGPARELAIRVWEQATAYQRAFGYPTAEAAAPMMVKPEPTRESSMPALTESAEHPLAIFWKQDRLANIIPRTSLGGEFPEGWDVRAFLQEWLPLRAGEQILEVGCGYGRLCEAFPAEQYRGIDINPEAIGLAKQRNPSYRFEVTEYTAEYPRADAILAYTVLLHVDDLSIGPMLQRCSRSAPVIVVAEILGRQRWRRSGNPPVYNRDLADYIGLFRDLNYHLVDCQERPYAHYSQTNISFLKFQRAA